MEHVLIDIPGYRVSYSDKYDTHAEVVVNCEGHEEKSKIQYDVMSLVLHHRKRNKFESMCHDIAENMGLYADSNWKKHIGEDQVSLRIRDEASCAYERLYHTKPAHDLLERLIESETVCKGFDHMLDIIADRERVYMPKEEWVMNPKQVETMSEVGMSTKDFI